MAVRQEEKSASIEAYREHGTPEAGHDPHAWREQVDQVRRRQRSVRALAQSSAHAYVEFLDSLFSYYRESMGAVERGTREG